MILLDFNCPDCHLIFEELVDRDKRVAKCPKCGAESKQRVTAKTGHLNNPGSPEVAEALRKRSYDHSVREARRNPEKIASKLGGVPRSQQPWNLRNKKSSSE
jgi:putative FmdB family regulatory protein